MADKERLIYRGPALDKEFKDAIKHETALPRHPQARQNYLLDAKRNFSERSDSPVLGMFPKTQVSHDAMHKFGQYGTRDAIMARPRYYDPIRSYSLVGIPFQMQLEAERVKIRQWCRFYMMTHHLIPTAVEIFARFPLIGYENVCKDTAIKDFYDELYLDESSGLNYKNFLVQLGLEYWTCGEAFAFGDWSDDLGVWTSEQLMDPDLIKVEYFSFLKTRAYEMKIPEHLRKLVQEKKPKQEYEILSSQFGDMIPSIMKNEPIPIDSDLMRQIRCGGAEWETHGVPILMRAFRQLMLEEKLNMSQMAIAERMYLPLLVGKMGSAGYGPENNVWIPTTDQLGSLRDDIELAMSSDFRFMATHWAVDFQNVFGREVVPDMTADFDQIEKRILAVFGISESLISGQSSTPYASTALNADFLNQRLKSYQDEIKTHVKERYRAVAAAQGFYDYEKKGNRLVPLFIEEVVYNPETGEKRKELKRKLLYPDPIMRILDLRDEATQRDFLFKLRENGVPIADSTLMIGVEFDFDDELEKRLEQERSKIIAQQQSNKQLYNELKEAGLPIPSWLKAEMAGIPAPQGDEQPSGGPSPSMPEMGGGEDLGGIEGMEGQEPMEMGTDEGAIIKPLPTNKMRPEESSEEMAGMPKPPASLLYHLRKEAENGMV